MANHYFVCSRNRPPVSFDISQDRPVDDAEIAYFIRIARILTQDYGLDGVTVCFAYSSLTKLPRIGPNVIAIVYGDEQCRIPAYAGQVRAVLKCHGMIPPFVPRLRPLRLAQIEIAEFLRNVAIWLPTCWHYLLSPEIRSRCHLVPIGYGLPTTVAPVSFEERPYIASFVGSIPKADAMSWPRRLIGTPKWFCRNALIQVMRDLQVRYPDGQIMLSLTGSFQESLEHGDRPYSQALANTRLCVAPRGTTMETWRICDGLQLGCVVIADHLPPYPFYRDSPIIRISDWRELPALIERLLADPDGLRALGERSLKYWHEVLSEAAQAAHCAAALGLVRQAARPAAA